MKANETPQVTLLERDVHILFNETIRLRKENELLKAKLKNLGG